MNCASLCFRCVVVHDFRVRLSWTSHPFVVNFISVCHELHVVVFSRSFVMDFAFVRLVCHDLRIVAHPFTSVCHGRHIHSPGLSSATHSFTWFVANFTFVRHELHIVAHRFVWFVVIFTSVVYLLICSRWLSGGSLVCYGGGLVLSRGCCLCHGLVASVHTSCVGFAFARFVGCCCLIAMFVGVVMMFISL